MQGYILNINRAKDEDLIVTVLSEKKIETLYRFYGARHAHINLGYKIDFEARSSLKSSIAQLRDVLHLAFKWNLQHERMLIWQQFIKLFYQHLKGVDTIDAFYFELLEEACSLWQKQNPKRIAIEKYTKLLEYEGRLHDEMTCFACEQPIEENPSLVRAFLPAHKSCAWSDSFKRAYVKELFLNKSTMFFTDKEVERLWRILQEGF